MSFNKEDLLELLLTRRVFTSGVLWDHRVAVAPYKIYYLWL